MPHCRKTGRYIGWFRVLDHECKKGCDVVYDRKDVDYRCNDKKK